MCLRCNTSISGINLFLKLAEGVGKISNGKWRERERGRKSFGVSNNCDWKKICREGKRANKKEQSKKWMKHMMRNEHVSCLCVCVRSSAAHCFNFRPLINVILPSLSPSLFFLPDLWVSLLLFFPHLFLSPSLTVLESRGLCLSVLPWVAMETARMVRIWSSALRSRLNISLNLVRTHTHT